MLQRRFSAAVLKRQKAVEQRCPACGTAFGGGCATGFPSIIPSLVASAEEIQEINLAKLIDYKNGTTDCPYGLSFNTPPKISAISLR